MVGKQGFPEEAKDCKLVFLDPPYGYLMAKEYSKDSISSLPIDKFLEAMEKIAQVCYDTLAESGHLALVMRGIMRGDFTLYDDVSHQCITIFESVGFVQMQRISVPMPPSIKSALDVIRFKKKKQLLNLNRDLIIFKKAK